MNLNELLESLEQSAGIEKQASTPEVKPAIAEELAGVLEKRAEQDLTKQAFAEGERLAKELLAKMANEIQTDNAVMVASDDQKVTPTSEGTVEQVLEETVDKALAAGAESENKVEENGQGEVAVANPAEQTKQAEENIEMSNNVIIQTILEKLAADYGDVSAPAAGTSSEGAAVPNKIQEDLDVMTAQHDAIVSTTPGAAEGGTINQVYEAIVAKAKAQGGGSDNLIEGENAQERDLGQVKSAQTDEQEKAAAVSALCDEGVSFEDAIALVKAAEQEILAEEWEQEKKAAFDALIEAGVDFEDSVALVKAAEEQLVKEASIASAAKGALAKVKDVAETGAIKAMYAGDAAKAAAGAAKNKVVGAAGAAKDSLVQSGKNIPESLKGLQAAGMKGLSMKQRLSAVGQVGKELASNRAVQAAGAVAGVAGAGLAAKKMTEKKAAFDMLVEQGVDFETAAQLVKAAADEVYGE